MSKQIEAHIYIHNGILLDYKKEHFWVSSNEVNEPRTYYTEWSKLEREIKETIPFTIATERIKYLHINLPKDAKYLYAENYKPPMKKSMTTQTNGEIYHVLELEKSTPCKWLYYPKQSTDPMQSLSNYQWHFSQN